MGEQVTISEIEVVWVGMCGHERALGQVVFNAGHDNKIDSSRYSKDFSGLKGKRADGSVLEWVGEGSQREGPTQFPGGRASIYLGKVCCGLVVLGYLFAASPLTCKMCPCLFCE